MAVDFGIMGRVDMADAGTWPRSSWAFSQRDYVGVADVFFAAGFVPRRSGPMAFVQAVRSIGEPILGLPLEEISFGRLLGQLLARPSSFEMETQPQLLLLQKTMVVAEGVGRLLNPRDQHVAAGAAAGRAVDHRQSGSPGAAAASVADGLDTIGPAAGPRAAAGGRARSRSSSACGPRSRPTLLPGLVLALLLGALIGAFIGLTLA